MVRGSESGASVQRGGVANSCLPEGCGACVMLGGQMRRCPALKVCPAACLSPPASHPPPPLPLVISTLPPLSCSGADGKTYADECNANCVGVPVASRGVCEEPEGGLGRAPPACTCAAIFRPVWWVAL